VWTFSWRIPHTCLLIPRQIRTVGRGDAYILYRCLTPADILQTTAIVCRPFHLLPTLAFAVVVRAVLPEHQRVLPRLIAIALPGLYCVHLPRMRALRAQLRCRACRHRPRQRNLCASLPTFAAGVGRALARLTTPYYAQRHQNNALTCNSVDTSVIINVRRGFGWPIPQPHYRASDVRRASPQCDLSALQAIPPCHAFNGIRSTLCSLLLRQSMTLPFARLFARLCPLLQFSVS